MHITSGESEPPFLMIDESTRVLRTKDDPGTGIVTLQRDLTEVKSRNLENFVAQAAQGVVVLIELFRRSIYLVITRSQDQMGAFSRLGLLTDAAKCAFIDELDAACRNSVIRLV